MGESSSRFVLSGQVLWPCPDERRNRWLTGTGSLCHEMLPDPFRMTLSPRPIPDPNSNSRVLKWVDCLPFTSSPVVGINAPIGVLLQFNIFAGSPVVDIGFPLLFHLYIVVVPCPPVVSTVFVVVTVFHIDIVSGFPFVNIPATGPFPDSSAGI